MAGGAGAWTVFLATACSFSSWRRLITALNSASVNNFALPFNLLRRRSAFFNSCARRALSFLKAACSSFNRSTFIRIGLVAVKEVAVGSTPLDDPGITPPRAFLTVGGEASSRSAGTAAGAAEPPPEPSLAAMLVGRQPSEQKQLPVKMYFASGPTKVALQDLSQSAVAVASPSPVAQAVVIGAGP